MSNFIKDLEEADRAHVLHPFAHLRDFADGRLGPPRIVTGGEGIRICDQQGREIIDAFSGLYCVNVGYGRTEIAKAIYAQAKKIAYAHAYYAQSTEAMIRLSERIIGLAPKNMERVFYGLSGSDANETQIKLVWYYHNVIGKPEKKKIIARRRGYHGSTVMAGSLTGLPLYHALFDQPCGPVRHTEAAHYYGGCLEGESEEEFSKRRARELEELILAEGPETVGAFIAEPAMGTGGLTPPPKGYWTEIQKIVRKYDLLLIADEVITGFGRTGNMFGCETYDIKPDLMTVAKGLTSAYAPLSGVIISKKVSDVLKQGSDQTGLFAHGYTYTGHALGAAAALANLDILERENLVARAADMGAYLQERMRETFAGHPLVGEVRGVGLMNAIEFVADKEKKTPFDESLKIARRVSDAALEGGVIVRAMPNSNALGMAPPFVISRDEIDRVVEIIAGAVERVTGDLARDNLWKAA